MTRVTQDLGWLLDLNAAPLGSALVVDAPIGATELVVADVIDFDESGGTLLLGGELLGYASTDPDTETIVLNGPLAEAAEIDDFVAVWDDENGKAAAEIRALVEFINTNGDDDPVAATLTHSLAPQLALGPRDGRGETVLLEEYGGAWRIIDVLGKDLVLDITSGVASAPAAPEGLDLDAAVYTVGGRNYARVQAAWQPVTTRVNGDDLDDLDHYLVQSKLGLPADTTFQWGNDVEVPAGTTDVMMQPFNVNQLVSVRVQAVTENGIAGPWSDAASITTSDDDEAPATPSTPTTSSRLGTVKVFWNGLNVSGGVMDADFDYVEVHASTTPTFTPVPGDTGTVIGRLYGAGYHIMSVGPTGYNTTWYYRLVAVDTSGNASAASASASSEVKPLVDVSNFPDDAMTVLYARTGHFIDLTAANFSANLIQADYIDFGSLYGELITGLQIQTDVGATTGIKIKNTGIEAYNSVGTRTFYVNATTGAVEIQGSLTSGSSITGASITGGSISGATFGTIGDGTSAGWRLSTYFLQGKDAGGTTTLYGSSADGTWFAQGSMNTAEYKVNGNAVINSSRQFVGSGGVNTSGGITGGDMSGSKLTLTSPNTGDTGEGSGLRIRDSGVVIKVTSSQRYKTDIEPLEIDLDAAYAVTAMSYHRTDTDQPGMGFIAELLAAAGFGRFVGRDALDRPDTVNYEAYSALVHQTLIQDLDRRLRAIETAA